ncbi:MAG: transporter substrate-binding domain-containing protein, partial [Bacteroidaceae bacterium]
MKRIFNFIEIILFSFCFQHTIHAESIKSSIPPIEKTLIIKGNNNFFPFEYLNETGEPEGFNIDLIRAIMKKLNRHYQLKLEPIDKVLNEFKHNNVDIITGLTNSPFWGDDFLFTNPHYAVGFDIISRKKDQSYKSTHDLIGKEVIVRKNGWGYNYLLSQKGIKNIIIVNELSEGMKLLDKGKHDAILCSEPTSLAVEREGYKNLIIQKAKSASQGYCMVTHKNDPLLQKQINDALRELRYDGTYNQIFHTWFQDKEKKNIPGSILLAILILCISSAIAILFNVLLRYRIKKVTQLLENTNRQMKLAIATGGIDLWTYNIQEQLFYYVYGKEPINYIDNQEVYTPSSNEAHKNKKRDIVAFTESLKKLHPDFLDKYKNEFNAIINGNKESSTFVVQTQNRVDGQQYNYLEFTITGVKDKTGKVIKIRGLERNITEEQQQKIEIEQNIILLNSIYKNLPIGLCVYDKEGKRIVINEACLTIFGITDKDTALKSNLHDESNIPQKYKDQLYKGEDVNYVMTFQIDQNETAKTGKKKGIVHLETKVAVLHSSTGSIDGYLFIYNDITSSIETQQNLKSAKEEAERSNKLKSAFLANMSHEIRTPLNAIVGFSELLISAEDQKERDEFYKIITTNNELLLKLINDILDLSKIEAGYLELKNIPFEINAMFNEIAFSLKQRIKEDVELRTNLPCENCWINLDRNRLIQVLTNFGTNAIKYTHKGNITLGYELIDDGLKLYVSDTGTGIPNKDLSKVF